MTGNMSRVVGATIAGALLGILFAVIWLKPDDAPGGFLLGFGFTAGGFMVGLFWDVRADRRRGKR